MNEYEAGQPGACGQDGGEKVVDLEERREALREIIRRRNEGG